MTRSRHRKQGRARWLVALTAALAVLVLVVAMAWVDREGDPGNAVTGDPAGDPAGTPTAEPSEPAAATSGTGSRGTSADTPVDDIPTLEVPTTTTAGRLDAVPLTGSAPPGATLRVQVADEAGGWSSYPLSVVSGPTGRFTTYVELGRLGPNRLRILEPATGATSNEVTVTVG